MSPRLMDEEGGDYLDQIRVSPAQLERLLDEAGRRRSGGNIPKDSRRARERFGLTNVGLTVMHPGGSEARFRVHAIEVSATGMSFLHSGFLHVGSTCSIVIAKPGGDRVSLVGAVANCAYVANGLHRVGMVFDRLIDLDRLVDPSDTGCESVSGVLVYIEQMESARMLVEHELRTTEIEVVSHTSLRDGLSSVKGRDTRRVLLDMATVEEDPMGAIDSIHGVGYLDTILLTASDPRSSALLEVKETAGPVLLKPFAASELIRFLSENWPSDDEEEVGGEVDQTSLLRIVERYVSHVRDFAHDLDEATLGADFDRALKVCHRLKGSGDSFGFPEITAAAAAAITALYAGEDLIEARDELRRLREACAHISAAKSTRLADK